MDRRCCQVWGQMVVCAADHLGPLLRVGANIVQEACSFWAGRLQDLQAACHLWSKPFRGLQAVAMDHSPDICMAWVCPRVSLQSP